MPSSSQKPSIAHQETPNGHIVSLKLPHPMDDERIELLTDQLAQVLKGRLNEAWAFDLASVPYLNSAMLGVMVNLRHQIKSSGGRLVLCGLSPAMLELFRNSSMERLFTIAKDCASALR